MRTFQIILVIALFLAFSAAQLANAQDKNLVEVAVSSEDHTTLVAAVKAGELVETLSGDTEFTVFAPTNAAFANLPKGTVESLLKPENKKMLQGILTYHVIQGKFDAKAVTKAIKKGKGKAKLTTVQGGILEAYLKDGKVMLKDEKGNAATVTATNLQASNGIIHVINQVVLPE